MKKTIFVVVALCFCSLIASAARSPTEVNATASPALIDTLTVMGAVLQGQVTGLTSDGLSFSLIYGQGSIDIPYKNIEQLRTEHQYHIFYNGRESVGRIVSIYKHRWLVVEDGDRRELIDVNDIERFILSVHDDDSFVNRLHNLVPFWSGNFDLGLEYEQGGTNKRKFDVAARFEYNRLEQRIVIIGTRALELQQSPDTNWSTTKNEYLFSVEDDYYVTRKQEEYLFLSSGFEGDTIRNIQSRIYPAGGLGYKLTFSKDFWWSLQLGIGGVFNQYIGYGEENYAALYTGSELTYRFWQSLLLRGKVLYMPSIFYERAAWLFRASASLTFPITELFALKFIFTDVDDNNPSPDIGNNKITTSVAVSFTF